MAELADTLSHIIKLIYEKWKFIVDNYTSTTLKIKFSK